MASPALRAATAGSGAVLIGSRPSRGGAVLNATNGSISPSIQQNSANYGRVNNYSNTLYPAGSAINPNNNGSNGSYNGPVNRGGRAVSFGAATGQPTYSNPSGAVSGSQPNNAGMPATTAPASRRGFFGGFFGNGSNAGSHRAA